MTTCGSDHIYKMSPRTDICQSPRLNCALVTGSSSESESSYSFWSKCGLSSRRAGTKNRVEISPVSSSGANFDHTFSSVASSGVKPSGINLSLTHFEPTPPGLDALLILIGTAEPLSFLSLEKRYVYCVSVNCDNSSKPQF